MINVRAEYVLSGNIEEVFDAIDDRSPVKLART
jgi:hypothetical protein